MLVGAGDVGALLAGDERVDAVAFTGSVETGKKVAAACLDRMARVNLEMGGKDPFIVCSDVAPALDVAARGGAWAAFLNAGQVCTSAERFYVMSDVYDDYVQAFVDHTRTLVVGDPMDAATDIGPMVSAGQREKVERQVEAAVAAGAEVLVGGDRAGQDRGHFFAPTVVTGAPRETDLLREETFGPVAPIVPVSSIDEAIDLANSTRFGLGANVYTQDLKTVLRCMREIKSGHGLVQRPAHRQRRRAVRRLQAVGPGARARARGPRGVPGDEARPHRDRAGAEGMVVSLFGVQRGERSSRRRRCLMDQATTETRILRNFVGGGWVDAAGDETLDDVNPATGEGPPSFP